MKGFRFDSSTRQFVLVCLATNDAPVDQLLFNPADIRNITDLLNRSNLMPKDKLVMGGWLGGGGQEGRN